MLFRWLDVCKYVAIYVFIRHSLQFPSYLYIFTKFSQVIIFIKDFFTFLVHEYQAATSHRFHHRLQTLAHFGRPFLKNYDSHRFYLAYWPHKDIITASNKMAIRYLGRLLRLLIWMSSSFGYTKYSGSRANDTSSKLHWEFCSFCLRAYLFHLWNKKYVCMP